MKEIRITVRCTSSPTKHIKLVRVKARLGRRKAEELAELLDGTSLAYVHPPGPWSPIGHCAACGAEVETTVSDVVDGKEQPPDEEELQRRDRIAERKLARQVEDTEGFLRKSGMKEEVIGKVVKKEPTPQIHRGDLLNEDAPNVWDDIKKPRN